MCEKLQVYEHLVFKGSEHVSLRSLPGMRDRCIRIGSAGKTFSLTAWKVGRQPWREIDFCPRKELFLRSTSSTSTACAEACVPVRVLRFLLTGQQHPCHAVMPAACGTAIMVAGMRADWLGDRATSPHEGCHQRATNFLSSQCRLVCSALSHTAWTMSPPSTREDPC